MRLHGIAQRLTILVDLADQWHHHPVYVEIVHRAHRQGLAGATVFHGEQGFTAGSNIHTSHPLWPGGHLPVMIVIVDDHAHIGRFLATVGDVLRNGVAFVDDVEVVRYRSAGRCAGAPGPVGGRGHRPRPPR